MKDYYLTISEAREAAIWHIRGKQDNQRVLIVKLQGSSVYLVGSLYRGEELRPDARIVAEY